MSGFRFEKNATVWWPVRWAEPVDGGTTREVSIELRFRRLKDEEMGELLKLPLIDFLPAAANDWRGIADADGVAVPFEPQWQREWLSIPAVAEALVQAWLACQRAEPETRLGNFAASPAGGPAAAGPTADQPASVTR
jgi:hypothetical protein